jgi:hypothetical protein
MQESFRGSEMWLYLGLGFVSTFVLEVVVAPLAGILGVIAVLLCSEPENRPEMTVGALLGIAGGFGLRLVMASMTDTAALRFGP